MITIEQYLNLEKEISPETPLYFCPNNQGLSFLEKNLETPLIRRGFCRGAARERTIHRINDLVSVYGKKSLIFGRSDPVIYVAYDTFDVVACKCSYVFFSRKECLQDLIEKNKVVLQQEIDGIRLLTTEIQKTKKFFDSAVLKNYGSHFVAIDRTRKYLYLVSSTMSDILTPNSLARYSYRDIRLNITQPENYHTLSTPYGLSCASVFLANNEYDIFVIPDNSFEEYISILRKFLSKNLAYYIQRHNIISHCIESE